MLFGNVHQHQSRDVQPVARGDLRAGENRVAGVETGKPRKAKEALQKANISQGRPSAEANKSQGRMLAKAKKSQRKPRVFAIAARAAAGRECPVGKCPADAPQMSTDVYACLRLPTRPGGGAVYFQIALPLPGRPSSVHIASTFFTTSSLMRILRPHSRLTSPGHLSVASRPILAPRPETGEAKSR